MYRAYLLDKQQDLEQNSRTRTQTNIRYTIEMNDMLKFRFMNLSTKQFIRNSNISQIDNETWRGRKDNKIRM